MFGSQNLEEKKIDTFPSLTKNAIKTMLFFICFYTILALLWLEYIRLQTNYGNVLSCKKSIKKKIN